MNYPVFFLIILACPLCIHGGYEIGLQHDRRNEIQMGLSFGDGTDIQEIVDISHEFDVLYRYNGTEWKNPNNNYTWAKEFTVCTTVTSLTHNFSYPEKCYTIP